MDVLGHGVPGTGLANLTGRGPHPATDRGRHGKLLHACRLLAALTPIADSALNGMVLLGEGGRVQIAVLCSTLGFGIGRCRLAYQA
jgi:hypothetical protein